MTAMAKLRTTKQSSPSGFAQRLKQIRLQKSLSQSELAERAGIHFTSVSRYERGTALPNSDALQNLARALEISTDYLMEGEPITAAPVVLPEDEELLQQFREIQLLPAEEKNLVKKVLEALLLRRKLQAFAASS